MTNSLNTRPASSRFRFVPGMAPDCNGGLVLDRDGEYPSEFVADFTAGFRLEDHRNGFHAARPRKRCRACHEQGRMILPLPAGPADAWESDPNLSFEMA